MKIKEIILWCYKKLTKPFRIRRYNVLEKLIKKNNYKSFAEIGVWEGHTSHYLLKRCKGLKRIVCVDSYKLMGDYANIKKREGSNKIHFINAKKIAMEKLNNPKVEFYSLPSNIACKKIKDKSLDIVFIDSNHQYKEVKKDIQLWLPKIRNGGIIAGHDFKLRRLGVVQAVLELLEPIHTEQDSVWWKRVERK